MTRKKEEGGGQYPPITLKAPSAFFAAGFMHNMSQVGMDVFFAEVLDNAPGFVVCFERTGALLYANMAFVSYSWRDIHKPGFTFFDQFSSKDLEMIRPLFKEVGNGEAVSRSWVSSKSRKGRVVEWKIQLLKFPNTESLFLAWGSEITDKMEERERMQALLNLAADQNHKLKSFTHIVSHHIRSHAGNILGLVDLLDDPAESPEDKREYTSLIRLTADQLDQTIRNLNQVIEIQDSLSKPRAVRNLSKAISRTMVLMEGEADAAGAHVDIQVDEKLWVDVVPSYLNHILLNLVSNALKFKSPARPLVVRISAAVDGGFVVLEVADNGLGIDLDKFKDRLFKLYETFHRTADSRGFGLFITKVQAESMGGRVEVKSKPGEGSTFRVFLKSANSLVREA
ncbi:MAG: HAMP domain-containing histidine kinase [Lunatimonas sp.]|uniref:sensor histidine kinase n=1 Tax=Lunatimonas sp. TaxID=2060141 RepID=UPI00263B4A14|nr:HAMP domain-containing sensor histidine kinase [Lunatimonas sp.]MCC5938121.1 HAMP domain-containing histidine kinase [Lunatimonas sp.]